MNEYKLVVTAERYPEDGKITVTIEDVSMAAAKKCARQNGYTVHAIICTKGEDKKAALHEAAREAGFSSVKAYKQHIATMKKIERRINSDRSRFYK